MRRTMNALWTYMLTRLKWYACDFLRWILYITLHITNFKASCQMHFIAHSQVHSQLHWMAHSQPAWLYAPSKLSRRSKAHSWARSQVHSQSHMTIWFHVYSGGARSRDVLRYRHQAPGGGWREAGGRWCWKWRRALWASLKAISFSLLQRSLYIQNDKAILAAPPSGALGPGVEPISNRQRVAVAEIMTSVDIIVWTLSLAGPSWQDLTMPHGHGVENRSLRLRRNGRQFELGESRSPTQICQRTLLPTSTVLEPSTSQSFYRPRAVYKPKLPQT